MYVLLTFSVNSSERCWTRADSDGPGTKSLWSGGSQAGWISSPVSHRRTVVQIAIPPATFFASERHLAPRFLVLPVRARKGCFSRVSTVSAN